MDDIKIAQDTTQLPPFPIEERDIETESNNYVNHLIENLSKVRGIHTDANDQAFDGYDIAEAFEQGYKQMIEGMRFKWENNILKTPFGMYIIFINAEDKKYTILYSSAEDEGGVLCELMDKKDTPVTFGYIQNIAEKDCKFKLRKYIETGKPDYRLTNSSKELAKRIEVNTGLIGRVMELEKRVKALENTNSRYQRFVDMNTPLR